MTHEHQHGGLTLSIRTRTRLFGHLNVAIAQHPVCGWGTCEHPRRTFYARHQLIDHGGPMFVRLNIDRGLDTIYAKAGTMTIVICLASSVIGLGLPLSRGVNHQHRKNDNTA